MVRTWYSHPSNPKKVPLTFCFQLCTCNTKLGNGKNGKKIVLTPQQPQPWLPRPGEKYRCQSSFPVGKVFCGTADDPRFKNISVPVSLRSPCGVPAESCHPRGGGRTPPRLHKRVCFYTQNASHGSGLLCLHRFKFTLVN